jgi:uridine kinase
MADRPNNNFMHGVEGVIGTLAIYFTTIAFFVFAAKGKNYILPEINYIKDSQGDFIDEFIYTSELVPPPAATPTTPPRLLHTKRQADGKDNIFMSPISSSSYIVQPLVQKINSASTDDVIVIGIAGGSGSGKTTLSEAIYREIGKENICYISHDSYYKDLSQLTMKERENFNFDHPDALDTDLLVQHVKSLKDRQAVHIPKYDFTIHSRIKDTSFLTPKPVILIEGILIFSDKALYDEIDIKIFVDTEDDIRLVRRIRRDTVERGRTIDSVLQQYITTVRPMHLQFVEPSKRNADIIVPVGLNSVALDLVVSKLKHHLNIQA